MKKTWVILLVSALIVSEMSSCGADRTVVHSKYGRIRHVKVRHYSPWYTPAGSGYGKRTRRSMRSWDKHLRTHLSY
jgi:hypothetical protein